MTLTVLQLERRYLRQEAFLVGIRKSIYQDGWDLAMAMGVSEGWVPYDYIRSLLRPK